MTRCGWCNATELEVTVNGLEAHKPGYKKSLPNTRDCNGYVTYLEKESQPKQPKK